MLYLSADSDDGLLVFLGIGDENIERIEADDPLVANLSYLNYPGVFFLYSSESGEESPKMAEIREKIGITLTPWCSMGATKQQLKWLKKGCGFFILEPKDKMVGVAKITVLYCKDQKEMVKTLKAAGLMKRDLEVTYVPRSPEDN
jgi:hypothetical protein